VKLLKEINLLEDLGINIFEYYDYRSLLDDIFQALRSRDGKYSFRFFAKLLRLKSPGYIQSILNGKRNLSETVLGRIIENFGFSTDEREYLEILVRIKKTSFTNPFYPVYKSRLQEIRAKKLKLKLVKLAQYECVSSWVHWVIREMFLLKGAYLNIQWIKKSLKHSLALNTRQIQQCLDDLREAKLIEIEGEKVTVPDPVLSLDPKSLPALLTHYHSEAILRSVESLSLDEENREFGSVIVATTKEKFKRFKEKLQKDRSEALQLLSVKPGEAEMIVSHSFQFFPVAELECETKDTTR